MRQLKIIQTNITVDCANLKSTQNSVRMIVRRSNLGVLFRMQSIRNCIESVDDYMNVKFEGFAIYCHHTTTSFLTLSSWIAENSTKAIIPCLKEKNVFPLVLFVNLYGFN